MKNILNLLFIFIIMSTRRRPWYSHHNNSFLKTLKDYIVPIIWFFLIIFLVYLCVKKPSTDVSTVENQKGIVITKEADSSAFISYQKTKKELTEGMELYKWEKINVKEWRVKIDNETFSINIKKLWELSYLKDWSFSLTSGEIWVDTTVALTVNMQFAKVKISPNSHLTLFQNEVNSTIYVVSGTVEVSNLKWRNTVLSSKEKIEVSRADAWNEKVDLSIKKTPLDELFLNSDWFIINKWKNYLEVKQEEATSWTTSTETENKTTKTNEKSNYIVFKDLFDESNVSSSVISISGAYTSEDISKIEVNWKLAVLNPETSTFKIEGVNVWNKENDLVFKIFDKNEDLKEKFVYTVYNDVWTKWNNLENSNKADSSWTVFNVDWTKFTFTAPTTLTSFTTYESFITIRWLVSAQNIDKVTVNDFKLSSFNWKTWRYHASVDYGNLATWTNVYEIKYYSWDQLIYKNYFTIIKKWNENTNSKVSNETEKNNSDSE